MCFSVSGRGQSTGYAKAWDILGLRKWWLTGTVWHSTHFYTPNSKHCDVWLTAVVRGQSTGKSVLFSVPRMCRGLRFQALGSGVSMSMLFQCVYAIAMNIPRCCVFPWRTCCHLSRMASSCVSPAFATGQGMISCETCGDGSCFFGRAKKAFVSLHVGNMGSKSSGSPCPCNQLQRTSLAQTWRTVGKTVGPFH